MGYEKGTLMEWGGLHFDTNLNVCAIVAIHLQELHKHRPRGGVENDILGKVVELIDWSDSPIPCIHLVLTHEHVLDDIGVRIGYGTGDIGWNDNFKLRGDILKLCELGLPNVSRGRFGTYRRA